MAILKKIFKGNKVTEQSAEIDKIFNYLQSITPIPDITYQYIEEYNRVKDDSISDFDSRYIHLYLIWEDFIISNTSMKLDKQFRHGDIRRKIRERVNLNLLDNKFRLVFLPETKQALYIYEIFVQYIIKYILKHQGRESLSNTLSQINKGTAFETVSLDSNGLDFSEFNKKYAQKLTFGEVTQLFKGLYTALYNTIENEFSKEIAAGFFNKIYKTLQQIYNRNIAGAFLHILPEQVLGFDEWLASLSKQELEKQVQEKTYELEELNESLEEKVKERTQRLQEAFDELKVLDHKKSEFISVVAHQLRTPLSGLKWTLSMLLKGDLGPINKDQENLIKKSYETNEHLINIINEILDTDLITTGKTDFTPTDANIRDIIAEVINEASPNAIHKNIKLKQDISKEVPKIFQADANKLSLVIQNLLDNAIKYSPKDSEINIKVSSDSEKMKMQISDHGIGIPEEQQKNIFERFYRAQNALRVQANGSGLGLFIAKNIVTMHGGKIWFDSKENEGTTFSIEIPLEQKSAAQEIKEKIEKASDISVENKSIQS